MTKVVIMAGGLGTRLQEETTLKPKPMVEIGEFPMLMHIMKVYAAHGFKEFVVALGYKGEMIMEYFMNHYYLKNGLTVNLGENSISSHGTKSDDLVVHLIDTGLNTQTGGRLKRLKKWIGDETFMMTYGDGVGNIDIKELVAFHKKHKKLATVTAVRPPARFGSLHIENGIVRQFSEKSQADSGWINGGFFVLEPEVLKLIDGDETLWERDPLEKLAKKKELAAFKHEGFWQPMDTMREVRLLQSLWESGKAPWKIW